MKFRIMSDCQIGQGKHLKRGQVVDLSERSSDDSKVLGLLAHAGRLGSMDPKLNPGFENEKPGKGE